VKDLLVDYIMALVEATRRSEWLSLGVSTRGALVLYRAAQACAFLQGRDYCVPDDVKRLVVPVFSHRIVVSAKYSSPLPKREQAESVIRTLAEEVEVPL
jgi:MoxR-like ATPase